MTKDKFMKVKTIDIDCEYKSPSEIYDHARKNYIFSNKEVDGYKDVLVYIVFTNGKFVLSYENNFSKKELGWKHKISTNKLISCTSYSKFDRIIESEVKSKLAKLFSKIKNKDNEEATVSFLNPNVAGFSDKHLVIFYLVMLPKDQIIYLEPKDENLKIFSDGLSEFVNFRILFKSSEISDLSKALILFAKLGEIPLNF